MADDREEREGEPKIRIVDRRILSDAERAGKGADTGTKPKLEIVGGGRPADTAEADKADSGAAEDHGLDTTYAEDEDGQEMEMTEEEAEQLRGEVEQQQFEALEKRMGRPLTEQEKDAVREEMDRQARSMASLEVTPILSNFMAEISSVAAVHMGLMPNPYTRLIARNDTQARLAIDSYSAVLEVVRPQLDPGLAREFERVLNDLKTNFVSITGGTIKGPSRIIH